MRRRAVSASGEAAERRERRGELLLEVTEREEFDFKREEGELLRSQEKTAEEEEGRRKEEGRVEEEDATGGPALVREKKKEKKKEKRKGKRQQLEWAGLGQRKRKK